ncbi:asparagine synthase (glutamine-hydrolyzing) [Asanoa iriomotensis]|uniref:asparagine synthase (glutamine-hydrolyzing) n=1 Tax=Asanoa iriomotensis TaxID=234613 RepID=A0ABQ4BZ95_9ACTN|nr:asparagine synthase (glutamine-hydrolyzing) [Asanoa iriomotensis]GIF55830.1 asparagine synthetase B [Asanoa iriomotensis]
MCGIAGIAYTDAAVPARPDVLRAACATLRHRGPDDDGVYAGHGAGLAVRRLAVIDPGGGQPVVRDEDGAVRAILNGEIYNHRRLREDLVRRGHRLASHCDTEVIPHLYEEYGTDFAAHLEGMFAIALWDERRRLLCLVRDRLGVKPLYYAVQAGRIVFGSEIKALLAADVKTTVDPQAISDFLSLMYVPGSRSIFAQVRKLSPASMLTWQQGRYTVKPYWSLAGRPQRTGLSARRAAGMLRELVTESVAAQQPADVPVGYFLSGGMDSSSVVAAARAVLPDAELKTFSVGFTDPSYDERTAAATVARQFGCDHTEAVVRPRAEDVADGLLSGFDEPFADPSMVPTYYLSQLAREQVTVVLSGDGGDEILAGYLTYTADRLARHYRLLPRALTAELMPLLLRHVHESDRRMTWQFKARRFVSNALESPGRSHYLWRVVLSEERKARLLHPDLLAALTDTYSSHAPHYHAGRGFDPLTRFQYTDTKVYLADDVLTKVDRAAMAHALEVRVPLLATPLVEFAFSLPGRLKMPGYQPKRLMRRAFADVLPPEIVRAPKRGFNAPMAAWLRGPYRPLVDAYLGREVLDRQGFLRFAEVDRLWRDHLAGTGDHSRELWAVLMLSMWAEKHRAYR